jgi:hypothetical protein
MSDLITIDLAMTFAGGFILGAVFAYVWGRNYV